MNNIKIVDSLSAEDLYSLRESLGWKLLSIKQLERALKNTMCMVSIIKDDKCIACGVCQRVCPANAITIIKQDNKLNSYIIDYNKCIFCGNCAFYCNTKAISMGNDYELATDNKDDLVVEFKKVKVAND